MSSPEGLAEAPQSGESSTDYSAMLREAKADVREGEEGYVQDVDKAQAMAESQDRYVSKAQSAEATAAEFTRLAEEREAAGRKEAAVDAQDRAGDYNYRAELARRKGEEAADLTEEALDRQARRASKRDRAA